MITNAIALAGLSLAGFYLIYRQLPRNVRRIIIKYSLLADLAALIITYVMFSGTITALVAAGIVSICTSVLLQISKYPERYSFIFRALDQVQGLIKQFNEYLDSLNTIEPQTPEVSQQVH